MKTALAPVLLFILLAAAARADVASSCKSTLQPTDVASAIGPDIRFQPVFSQGEWRGWRIYGTKGVKQLENQGIHEGSLLTHVCGVHVNEIFRNHGDICCGVDAAHQFEVRFGVKRFLIER